MSFLVRGDEGPTNIPEGKAAGLFQAIARAGLEAAGEGSFERTGRRRRGSKNRMAGQADNLRRSIERGLQSGGGEEFLPEPRRSSTTVYNRGSVMPKPKALDKFIPSKPTRMTKEEYDKMPKRARRKFELAPGMEDLIDRFPTQGDEGEPRKSRLRRRTSRRTSRGSKSRDEMRDPNARPTVRSENIL